MVVTFHKLQYLVKKVLLNNYALHWWQSLKFLNCRYIHIHLAKSRWDEASCQQDKQGEVSVNVVRELHIAFALPGKRTQNWQKWMEHVRHWTILHNGTKFNLKSQHIFYFLHIWWFHKVFLGFHSRHMNAHQMVLQIFWHYEFTKLNVVIYIPVHKNK